MSNLRITVHGLAALLALALVAIALTSVYLDKALRAVQALETRVGRLDAEVPHRMKGDHSLAVRVDNLEFSLNTQVGKRLDLTDRVDRHSQRLGGLSHRLVQVEREVRVLDGACVRPPAVDAAVSVALTDHLRETASLLITEANRREGRSSEPDPIPVPGPCPERRPDGAPVT